MRWKPPINWPDAAENLGFDFINKDYIIQTLETETDDISLAAPVVGAKIHKRGPRKGETNLSELVVLQSKI